MEHKKIKEKRSLIALEKEIKRINAHEL